VSVGEDGAVTHETRYAKTADGVYLAYQVVGSGPVDVVMDLHAFAGNVDLIWDEPDWGPLLSKMTEFSRLVVHDRRGSGASTRNAPPPNLETRAADLLVVLDAVGSEAPVLGAGASTGAMHALFAATYPDRASGLVWNYPRPRLAWAPDYPWGQRADAFEAALAEAAQWGTTEQARDQARNRAAQRLGLPHEERLPNATVHVLPGRSGLQIEAQMAIVRRLAGIERRPAVSTVLATVLFTDIIDSIRKHAVLGDRGWRELLHAHHAAVRDALSHWGGTEHDTAGDGFFASFVGPARAIHCAHEIADRVASMGIETRAGVHIGECELIDGKPGGLAVTIGARLLGSAGAREVIVSQTVKDLVAGSGFSFTDRGEHELKGVPELWRLYLAEPTRH
jgi:class 3 adenylate cyclase